MQHTIVYFSSVLIHLFGVTFVLVLVAVFHWNVHCESLGLLHFNWEVLPSELLLSLVVLDSSLVAQLKVLGVITDWLLVLKILVFGVKHLGDVTLQLFFLRLDILNGE